MAKKQSPSAASPASLKKSAWIGGQRTLHGFFSKPPSSSSPTSLPERLSPAKPRSTSTKDRLLGTSRSSQLTPVPSSDALEPDLEDFDAQFKASSPPAPKGLPSPVSADGRQTNGVEEEEVTARGTPSRRVCNQCSVAPDHR